MIVYPTVSHAIEDFNRRNFGLPPIDRTGPNQEPRPKDRPMSEERDNLAAVIDRATARAMLLRSIGRWEGIEAADSIGELTAALTAEDRLKADIEVYREALTLISWYSDSEYAREKADAALSTPLVDSVQKQGVGADPALMASPPSRDASRPIGFDPGEGHDR